MYRDDAITILAIALVVVVIILACWAVMHVTTSASYKEICEPVNLTFYQCFWMSTKQIAILHNIAPAIPI